jgi:ureidoglycolate dehydrogenase (NAD+)
MFQCLTSQMANNPLVAPALRQEKTGFNQNSVVAAIDIGLFSDVETFKVETDAMIDELKALPKAEGFSDILMPGEPEYLTLAERSQHGIPLPPGTVRKLLDAAERWGIDPPTGLSPDDGRR